MRNVPAHDLARICLSEHGDAAVAEFSCEQGTSRCIELALHQRRHEMYDGYLHALPLQPCGSRRERRRAARLRLGVSPRAAGGRGDALALLMPQGALRGVVLAPVRLGPVEDLGQVLPAGASTRVDGEPLPRRMRRRRRAEVRLEAAR